MASALPEERARFIRRTYAHLAFAVLAFLALEYVLLSLPGVERLATLMTQGFNWLLVLGLFMVVSLVADRMARSSASRCTSRPRRYSSFPSCSSPSTS